MPIGNSSLSAVGLVLLALWAGEAAAVRVSELAPGPLRLGMEKLPPAALRRAEEQLARMSFQPNDLPSLRVDSKGAVYFVCSFKPADKATVPEAIQGTGAAPLPITSPPVFHSRPGAGRVLFLDFNGHMISNTQWNTDHSVAAWNCRPFDTDGDTNTFSDTEQSYIRQVWERVAEDYAPFEVDVTTEQPATWNSQTAHALITPTTDANGVACPHSGYGGIAYVDVFGDPSLSYNAADCYSPAWVLPMSGSSYANTAEAAAHELGHNMGLSHDGTSSLGYYGGHGGSVSWGPIMGTGYGQNCSQWCKGEYYDANQLEDDLAVIAGKLTYRADDYGDSIGTASPLPLSGLNVAVTGVVETTGDPDVFAFNTGAGTVSFYARTYRCAGGTWGGNGDLVMTLHDVAGTAIASNNPAADTQASLTTALAAGTYYLQIRPTGVDTPLSSTPSGYTVYGSLGAYAITGAVTATGSNLFLNAPNAPATYYTGSVLQVQWSYAPTNAVRIDLLKNGALYLVLATNTPNDGEFSWLIPGSTPLATTYAIRVSDQWNPAHFDESSSRFTIQRPPVVLLNEPFNAATLPAGWSYKTNTGAAAWTYAGGGHSSFPGAAHSAPYNALLYFGSTSDHIVLLISPPFDLSGQTNATLVFWHAMAQWPPDVDRLAVLFRTNAAAAWTTQVFYNTDAPSWTERTLVLPGGSTNCAIAFEGNAKYGYGVCVDDVSLTAPAPAIPPETSDSDGDSLPDTWESLSGLNPVVSNAAPADADSDGATDAEEFIADTRPLDATSKLQPLAIVSSTGALFWVQMTPTSTGRLYDLHYSMDLAGSAWASNGLNRPGTGTNLVLMVTNAPDHLFMRGAVRLPP